MPTSSEILAAAPLIAQELARAVQPARYASNPKGAERLTVTLEDKSPQFGKGKHWVARNQQGSWVAYGAADGLPANPSPQQIAEYILHKDEIQKATKEGGKIVIYKHTYARPGQPTRYSGKFTVWFYGARGPELATEDQQFDSPEKARKFADSWRMRGYKCEVRQGDRVVETLPKYARAGQPSRYSLQPGQLVKIAGGEWRGWWGELQPDGKSVKLAPQCGPDGGKVVKPNSTLHPCDEYGNRNYARPGQPERYALDAGKVQRLFQQLKDNGYGINFSAEEAIEFMSASESNRFFKMVLPPQVEQKLAQAIKLAKQANDLADECHRMIIGGRKQ